MKALLPVRCGCWWWVPRLSLTVRSALGHQPVLEVAPELVLGPALRVSPQLALQHEDRALPEPACQAALELGLALVSGLGLEPVQRPAHVSVPQPALG